MIKRITCLILGLCVVFSMLPMVSAADVPNEWLVHQRILDLKEQYPEGSPWSNADSYQCKGNGSTGFGCVAFAYLVSDAAFGEIPMRKIEENISIDMVRAGDILRDKRDYHSVVVLEKHEDYITVVEGNYLETVHWGRRISAEDVAESSYMLTRYPDGHVPSDDMVIISDIPFLDIKNHWALDDISFCVENGLMTGMSEMMFEPDSTTTRAQLVTILWRYCQSPKPEKTDCFTDLTGDWYYDAVCWAAENGIVQGVSETEFAPNDNITREQLATILYRFYTVFQEQEVTVEGDLSNYADLDQVGDYALDAILWANASGIINGMDHDGLHVLMPTGNATRAQTAAMLNRFMNLTVFDTDSE